MLAAPGRHGSHHTQVVTILRVDVLDMVIAHYTAEALILFLVVSRARERRLEGAISPVRGVLCDIAGYASEILEPRAIVSSGNY